jgi:integrase/recombinase XerD
MVLLIARLGLRAPEVIAIQIDDIDWRAGEIIVRGKNIRRIVEAAAELPSINGIRALTCSTLFGLIAVTGLRVSEALSLDAADIDLENGVVTLWQGKLGKARLLPVAG